jgi:vacuolar protein sorting-associated protein VTA1
VPSQVAPTGYAPSDAQLLDAQKFAKYAVSALQFDDVPTAIKNLKLSLGLLTGQQFQ